MNKKLKYLTILFLTFSFNNLNAQWFTSVNNDRFDGEIRTAGAIGNSDDLSYKLPLLAVRIKKGETDLILSKISYLIEEVEVKIAFDDDENIYESLYHNLATDKQGIFFNKITSNGKTYDLMEFLKIITLHKKMYMRVKDRNSRFDVVFDLTDSYSAFVEIEPSFNNLVETSKKRRIELEKIYERQREELRLQKIQEAKRKAERLKEEELMAKSLNEIKIKLLNIGINSGLDENSQSNLRNVINEEELLWNSFSIKDIDSMFFTPISKRDLSITMTVQGYFVSKKYKLKDAGLYTITKESSIYKNWLKEKDLKDKILNHRITTLKEQTLEIIGDTVLTKSLVENIISKKVLVKIDDFDSISIVVEGKGSVIPTFYFIKNGDLIEKIDVFKKLPDKLISKLKSN